MSDSRYPADDEPAYEPAAEVPLAELRRRVESARADRCVVVAVDGRSAGGKTTFSRRLAGGQAGWFVVHTDDIAWHHSFFDWDDLLVQGVLAPVTQGRAVAYRPPGWVDRGRLGAVEVPADARVLVVEGVGAARRALAEWIDVAFWVHTPFETVLAREEARIASGHTSVELSRDWLTDEARFQAGERPWARADVVVPGTSVADAPATDDRVVVLADPAVVADHRPVDPKGAP